MKQKTILLRGPVVGPNDEFSKPKSYLVLRVTDSLDWSVGQYITKTDAQSLCDNDLWKVTFTQKDL